MNTEKIRELLKAIGLTAEEAIAEIVNVLSESEESKIKMFSEVEMRDVERLSLLFSIADRYKVSWLSSYLYNELQLRVSHKRQGRKEFAEILGAKTSQETKKTIIERVKGASGK